MVQKEREQPVFNTSGNEIAQVGIVVKDAVKTAGRFAELLGIGPWVFFDDEIRDGSLHGKPVKNGSCCLRLAFAYLGELEIELLQPLWGPSSHQEFLTARGDGVHHLSFGGIENSDLFTSALQNAGVEPEMLGKVSGDISFSYMSTQKVLGTIFEATTPVTEAVQASLKPWGTLASETTPLVDITGERLVQVGIVVEDLAGTVKNYEELFGVGPWSFYDLKPPYAVMKRFDDLPMADDVNTYIRAAAADLGRTRIELLEPVCGPSSYMNFVKAVGAGVNYLGFGKVKDPDVVVGKMSDHGIGIDMAGIIDGQVAFTNLGTQRELGVIIQIAKANNA
ncbi:MAG: VOC family protein [Deltaproteobacteria bacterium]|nr:VOC family protein [Deltaproteobacteria bacterium]